MKISINEYNWVNLQPKVHERIDERQQKLNPDKKLASQPELIKLRKTKLDIESVKKKQAERFMGGQMICFKSSWSYVKNTDTMKEHKGAIKISQIEILQ